MKSSRVGFFWPPPSLPAWIPTIQSAPSGESLGYVWQNKRRSLVFQGAGLAAWNRSFPNRNGEGWHEMAENDTLSPKQRRAVATLLQAPTVAGAARNTGVSERQMFRWLADPAFRAELREAESGAIDAAARSLAALASKALVIVGAILDAPDTPAGVKLRAAQVVLDAALRWYDLRNIDARLAALEAAQEGEQ